MFNKMSVTAALGAMLLVSAAANGQALQFGDFETVSPSDPTLPVGWNPFNGAVRRTVGDGLMPALATAHGGTAAIELTPRSVGPSDFVGFSSDALVDPLDALSPRNNPAYTYDRVSGDDIEVSGWFMIPASDPVVRHWTGLKLEFRRTADNSVYEGFDFKFADPANPVTPAGLVRVTTPTGEGLHTNGQWIFASAIFEQSRFGDWLLPPVNPDARCSVLAIRFGDPYVAGARGTVFWDDLGFREITSCPADFNGSGTVTVQDIFDFLAAYFSNSPSADVNNSGSVTVQDIFDYLALYFAGCP